MVSSIRLYSHLPTLACIACIALSPPALAGLEFRQVTADAHTVLTGQPLLHQFQFRNTGGFTDIVGVRTSCGCLQAKPTKSRYGPNETGAIELEINTLGQSPGPHRWVVRVTERNESCEKETALELTAEVRAEVSVQPASLDIYTQGKAAHELILTDSRPRPLAVTRVLTSSQSLAANFEPMDARAGTWRIRVSLTDSLPEGRHHERLVIVTNDDGYHELRIPVTVIRSARSRVSAYPPTLSIAASPGRPLPAPSVVLRDAREQPVRIKTIVADSEAVKCRWANGPGNQLTLRIELNRSRIQNDSLDCQVTVTLSSPTSESIVIPVHCAIR
jgi:hypothetical protein